MDEKELAELFQRFLDENGLFFQFKEWLEDQGWTLPEIGMEDEE